MKKFMILSTIILIIGIASIIAFSDPPTEKLEVPKYNRTSSYAIMTINAKYGSHYNPPTVLKIDGTGIDIESPLYSSAWIEKEYTDDGYDDGRTLRASYHDYPLGNKKAHDAIIAKGEFLGHDLKLITYQDHFDNPMGVYVWKDHKKKFAVEAYAWVSCMESYERYRTIYQFYAEVPPDFQTPNVRNPPPKEEFGSFSDIIDRQGKVNGWDYELPSEPKAWVVANGYHPSKDENHRTESRSTTPTNAKDLFIECDLCQNAVCSVCKPFR